MNKLVFKPVSIDVIRFNVADIIATSYDENGIEKKEHVVAE